MEELWSKGNDLNTGFTGAFRGGQAKLPRN